MTELRSQKGERDQVARSMRADGRSWVEVAEVLRQRYRLNARVALRYAHGWSQRQVAEEWNKRWPDELKTFKTFSYWEQWPSSTGHAPHLDSFAKLAQLYECAVSDLLVDLPDFRHLDAKFDTQITALSMHAPVVKLVSPNDPPRWPTATGLPLPDNFATLLVQFLGSWALPDRDVLVAARDRDQAYHQLVQFLHSWAHTVDRRNALRVLGSAAAVASLFPALDGDEQQRVAAVLSTPGRVDAQTIAHIEAVLWHCQWQDYGLGPRAVFHTVVAQRDLARELVSDCPDTLRPQLLSALSEASHQAGWLSFDLQRFDDASYYYEDARALAHEAENAGLGAFVLCEMSHLATWRGNPRTGIDHAVAAERWAHRTDDMRLRAYTADLAARAYAADGQRDACLAALDTAHALLTKADDQAPSYTTYSKAGYMCIRGACHLKLGETDHAISHAQQALKIWDPRISTRNVAMTLLDLSEAHAQSTEIDEAARLLGDAGEIATRHSSARLAERLTQGRATLQPWKDTAAVRQLDERLASFGVV
ncbi:MAG: hypothetical protein ACRDRS_07915 [Pseudonocardiaceae bacterium]